MENLSNNWSSVLFATSFSIKIWYFKASKAIMEYTAQKIGEVSLKEQKIAVRLNSNHDFAGIVIFIQSYLRFRNRERQIPAARLTAPAIQ